MVRRISSSGLPNLDWQASPRPATSLSFAVPRLFPPRMRWVSGQTSWSDTVTHRGQLRRWPPHGKTAGLNLAAVRWFVPVSARPCEFGALYEATRGSAYECAPCGCNHLRRRYVPDWVGRVLGQLGIAWEHHDCPKIWVALVRRLVGQKSPSVQGQEAGAFQHQALFAIWRPLRRL